MSLPNRIFLRFHAAFLILFLSAVCLHAELSPVSLEVDEGLVVKKWNPGILGINFDWTGMQSGMIL